MKTNGTSRRAMLMLSLAVSQGDHPESPPLLRLTQSAASPAHLDECIKYYCLTSDLRE